MGHIITLKKILLIDDSRSVLLKLKADIESMGYEVLTCGIAIQAFDMAKEYKPDCILTDYEMPEMQGPEICFQFKNDNDLRQIPILILTSKENDEYLIRALKKGADDFISKNVDPEIIRVKIAAALRTRDLQNELLELKKITTVKMLVVTFNHELNNALTLGCTWLRKLEDQVNKDGQYANYFAKISNAFDRVESVVKEITEVGKLQEIQYTSREQMFKIGKSK